MNVARLGRLPDERHDLDVRLRLLCVVLSEKERRGDEDAPT